MPAPTITPCASVDQPGWLELRRALWPEGDEQAHRGEMAAFLAQPERYGQFMAYGADGAATGFAEASIRADYVNGTESSPVAFLEGLYVAPGARGQGIARSLVAAVERWAGGRGCDELASDALVDNDASHAMHLALGFEETERVVYFRKRIVSVERFRPSAAAPAGITLRDATDDDAGAVAAIYNHYVLHTIVTFEEQPIDAAEMARRMLAVRTASLPWLVAEDGHRVVGYAYATPWKPRAGYRFTVEISIYLDREAGRRGIGTALYARLFDLLTARGIRNIIGGIALPNDASIALHEKFGMRKVAHFERNGIKFGQWIDVGYWQRVMPDEL
jgi:phosphinothricin acetyltransferase